LSSTTKILTRGKDFITSWHTKPSLISLISISNLLVPLTIQLQHKVKLHHNTLQLIASGLTVWQADTIPPMLCYMHPLVAHPINKITTVEIVTIPRHCYSVSRFYTLNTLAFSTNKAFTLAVV